VRLSGSPTTLKIRVPPDLSLWEGVPEFPIATTRRCQVGAPSEFYLLSFIMHKHDIMTHIDM